MKEELRKEQKRSSLLELSFKQAELGLQKHKLEAAQNLEIMMLKDDVEDKKEEIRKLNEKLGE